MEIRKNLYFFSTGIDFVEWKPYGTEFMELNLMERNSWYGISWNGTHGMEFHGMEIE